MKTIAGEIYLIREHDVLSGKKSAYAKIGLVKENDSRSSATRLEDHQTGNPRQLTLEAVVKTELVYWVEATMHRKYAPQRVKGEWFLLDDAQTKSAISDLKRLSKKAAINIEPLAMAEKYKDVASTGKIIKATPVSKKWFRQYWSARCQFIYCNELENLYKSIFRSLDNQEAIPHVGKTREIETSRFKPDQLKEKYPKLWNKYSTVTQSISGSFLPTKSTTVSVDKVNPDLLKFGQEFKSLASKVKPDSKGIEKLQNAYMSLVADQTVFDGDVIFALANLKALCGKADGIADICAWKRVEKIGSKIDRAALKREHPEEYEECSVRSVSKRTTISRKGQDRGKKS